MVDEFWGDPVGLVSAAVASLALVVLGACAETKVGNDVNPNWGEPVSQCRIAIVRANADPQRKVDLDIAFRNDGREIVLLPRTSSWLDFDFAVSDEAGTQVPLTEFGEQQRANLMTAAAALAEVEPGHTYRASVELSLLYRFERTGTYVVQASKTFRDPATHQFVTAFSNKLTIQVRED